MKRTILTVVVCLSLLAWGGSATFATTHKHKTQSKTAPAATTKPEDTSGKGSCAADGSCCGQAACAQAAGSGGKTEGASTGGGCPCMKNRQKPGS